MHDHITQAPDTRSKYSFSVCIAHRTFICMYEWSPNSLLSGLKGLLIILFLFFFFSIICMKILLAATCSLSLPLPLTCVSLSWRWKGAFSSIWTLIEAEKHFRALRLKNSKTWICLYVKKNCRNKSLLLSVYGKL